MARGRYWSGGSCWDDGGRGEIRRAVEMGRTRVRVRAAEMVEIGEKEGMCMLGVV